MLVLTRKVNERLMIGDNIVITIVAIGGMYGNEVRIGVEAPEEVVIDREEIYIRKQRGEPRKESA